MRANTRSLAFVSFALMLIGASLAAYVCMDIFPLGPTRELNVTVTRLYVDTLPNNKGSVCMVLTDKGVFEVKDSTWLRLLNSDEIFAKMTTGSNYTITVKGKRSINLFWAVYPGIIKVAPCPTMRYRLEGCSLS